MPKVPKVVIEDLVVSKKRNQQYLKEEIPIKLN